MVSIKKVSFITTRTFLPAYGGDKVRAKQFFDYFLSRSGYEITLTSFYYNERERKDFLENIPENVKVNLVKFSFLQSFIGILKALLFKYPLQCGIYYQKNMIEMCKEVNKDSHLIYGHLIRSYPLIKGYEYKTILDATDSLSKAYKYLRPNYLSPKYWFFKFDLKKINRLEKYDLRKTFKTIFIGQNEVEFLYDKDIPENIIIIPNGVEVNNHSNITKGTHLLFIGKATTLPNKNAIDFLLKNIAPSLSKSCKIIFAGKNSKKIYSFRSYKKLTKKNSIEIHESYSSISIFKNQCVCGIAPMFDGSGLQNKVLDYISIGLPVLATRVGLNGFNKNIENPFIESTAENIHENIIKLFLMNEKQWNVISGKSLKYLDEYFSLRSIHEKMDKELS